MSRACCATARCGSRRPAGRASTTRWTRCSTCCTGAPTSARWWSTSPDRAAPADGRARHDRDDRSDSPVRLPCPARQEMIGPMATDRHARRRLPLRTVSLVALLVTLVATAAAVWGARAVVDDQENRLLDERASEVSLVLTSAIDAIPASLSAQGGILKATGG